MTRRRRAAAAASAAAVIAVGVVLVVGARAHDGPRPARTDAPRAHATMLPRAHATMLPRAHATIPPRAHAALPAGVAGAAPVGPRAAMAAILRAEHPARTRPDPRPAAMRRLLALHPSERHAIWIVLDPRAAASTLPPVISDQERVRRARLGLGIVETDHPIAPAVVARLRRAGARIRVLARLTRAVSADVDSATAERVARLPEVIGMQPVLRLATLALPGQARGVRGDEARTFATDSFYGLNYWALQMLNIPAAHALGFTGSGLRIGMLDSGFDRTHEALAPINVPRIGHDSLGQYDFIWNDTIVSNQALDTAAYNQAFHGSATLSILAGRKFGTLVGAAYDAQVLLAKTEVANNRNIDSHQDEDRWVAGAEWLASQGVDLISSSLGYRYGFPDGSYPCSAMDGRTTITSREAARLSNILHILVVTAMGNEAVAHADPTTGSPACTLVAPSDADSILSVGAVDSLGVVWSQSSRGPTFDGRIKPGLVARGQGVSYAVSGTLAQYGRGNGTSYSTPLIAGAAGLVLQAWRVWGVNLAPMAVRQALVLSTNRGSANNNVGFGVPDVALAILFPQGFGIGVVTPTDALSQIASVAPTFSWVAGMVAPLPPITYRLEVANDSLFRQLLCDTTVADVLSLTPRGPFLPTNSLYWRVTASKGPAVRRQTGVSGPFVVPRWVRLLNLSEPAGSFTDSVRPVLRWRPLEVPAALGPMRFDVQVLDLRNEPIPGETVTGLTADSLKLPLPLTFNGSYRWRVIARVGNIADTVTSLGRFTVNSAESPPSTSLYQNFPNPFPRAEAGTTSTHIWFDLSASVPVELAIYDMRGRLVRRLIPAAGCPPQTLGPGQFGRISSGNSCVLTNWDGTDEKGRGMPRGVYLLRLRAGGVSQVRHIVYTP